MESASTEAEPFPQHMWERPLQDLAAIFLPYMTPWAAIAVGACIVYDPTMTMLLYRALTGQYQNWFTFWVCFVEEIRFMLIFIGIAIPVWQCQVIAFDLMNNKLQNTVRAMEIR